MKAIINGITIEGTPSEMSELLTTKTHVRITAQKLVEDAVHKIKHRHRKTKTAKRHWTKTDDSTLIELTQKQKSAVYIGKILNRTPIAVYERRSKLRSEGVKL